jgi:hypothetical protein
VVLVFREAEQRFLLLFLEKEENYSTNEILLVGLYPNLLHLWMAVMCMISFGAEMRFLLPFLEKNSTTYEHCSKNNRRS